MGYLYTVSAVLLALKLAAVSVISWELVILPAALQGAYNIGVAYIKYKALNKLIREVQESVEHKDDNSQR